MSVVTVVTVTRDRRREEECRTLHQSSADLGRDLSNETLQILAAPLVGAFSVIVKYSRTLVCSSSESDAVPRVPLPPPQGALLAQPLPEVPQVGRERQRGVAGEGGHLQDGDHHQHRDIWQEEEGGGLPVSLREVS